MTANNAYENLSKEELIVLLAKADKKIASRDKKIKQLHKANDRQAKENRQLRQVVVPLCEVADVTLQKVSLFLHKDFPPIALWDKEMVAEIIVAITAMHKAATELKSLHPFVNPGNESLPPVEQTIAHTFNELSGALDEAKETQKQVQRLSKTLKEVAKNTQQLQEIRPCLEAIDRHPLPESRQTMAEPKKKGGKKARQCPEQRLPSPQAPLTCPDCGGTLLNLASFKESVIATQEKANAAVNMSLEKLDAYQGAVVLSGDIKVMVCSKDNRVVLVRNKNMPLPTLPGRTVTHEMVGDSIKALSCGIALNNKETIDYRCLKFGSSTLYDNIADWLDVYGNLLLRALTNEIKSAPVIQLDETSYHVLAPQGLGPQKVDNEEKQSSRTLILAMTTPANRTRQVVRYTYLATRSAKSIYAALPTGFAPEVIETDGYAGYDTLMNREWKDSGIVHQKCLVHLRRKILEALELTKWEAAVKKLDDEAFTTELKKEIEQNSPRPFLFYLVRAFQNIYVWEKELKRTLPAYVDGPSKGESAIIDSRRAHARPMMDHIDALMQELAKGRVKRNKGRHCCVRADDAVGKMVVYYLNHRDSFRVFLEDARVDPDTNRVEQSIRPITVLRNSSGYAQTSETMQITCDLLSLAQTGKLNGIEDISCWLTDFGGAAVMHVLQKRWQQEANNPTGKNPNSNFRYGKEVCKELLEDFDVTPWLPWVWGKQP